MKDKEEFVFKPLLNLILQRFAKFYYKDNVLYRIHMYDVCIECTFVCNFVSSCIKIKKKEESVRVSLCLVYVDFVFNSRIREYMFPFDV